MPLVTNVNAELITSGTGARDALLRQVASPVRWSESIKLLLDKGVTRFIEVGPASTVGSGETKQPPVRDTKR